MKIGYLNLKERGKPTKDITWHYLIAIQSYTALEGNVDIFDNTSQSVLFIVPFENFYEYIRLWITRSLCLEYMLRSTGFAPLRHYDRIASKANTNNHTSPLVARGSLLFSSSSFSRLAGFSPAQGQSIKKRREIKERNEREKPITNTVRERNKASRAHLSGWCEFTLPFCGPAKAMMSDMAKRIAKTTVATQRALFWEHTIPLCS